MKVRRKIREEELLLIQFLTEKAGFSFNAHPIREDVEEYEGGVMGSIGMGKEEAAYQKDLIQVEYLDIDRTPVIITLTLDLDNQLLDLDFWKTDFSKLLVYPKPENISFFKDPT